MELRVRAVGRLVVTGEPFGGLFRGRRVLVTGHTGFKGAWLSEWLLGLGAEVSGVALAPNTDPALFTLLGLGQRLAAHHVADVRDHDRLLGIVRATAPEVVLHLAAQPLVRLSYREPKATWDTNVGGTVNLLEAVRAAGGVRACVVVTSDKCYENAERTAGYRESDPMGGHDPYSASKGAAELAVASWRRSFAAPGGCLLASARAGNVIGGGDWSEDRIVVDAVRAFAAGRPLLLRNPGAVRPWQHVLEPLSGYLALAARLLGPAGGDFAEAWNFGPSQAGVVTVGELAEGLAHRWGPPANVVDGSAPGQPHEARLLALDPAKADARLDWRGVWTVERTLAETVDWYRSAAAGGDPASLTRRQIDAYRADASAAGISWAGGKRSIHEQ